MRLRRLRGGGHLGPRAAAFVDVELDHEGRERVLRHLADCPDCRAEVAAQRRLKARLADLDAMAVPGALAARLARLAAAAGSPRFVPVAHPSLRARVGQHRTAMALAAAASVALGGFGAAFALGGAADGGPAVVPPLGRYVDEHAATVNELPLVDSGVVSAVTVSYAGAAGR